jgi:hypothetical protein
MASPSAGLRTPLPPRFKTWVYTSLYSHPYGPAIPGPSEWHGHPQAGESRKRGGVKIRSEGLTEG